MSCGCNRKCNGNCTRDRYNRCGSYCDNGCLDIVYPDCFVLKKAYSCLGLSAGQTGTDLLASIESLACNVTPINIVGCTYNVNSGEYATINVTNSIINGVKTYKVCLAQPVIDQIVEYNNQIDDLQDDVTAIQEEVDEMRDCCNTNTIAISDINTAITPETWKYIGAGGNMANSQPVPGFAAGVANFPSGEPLRLRKLPFNYVEFSGLVQTSINNATAQPITLFTLPVGYRPPYTLSYNIGITFGFNGVYGAVINIATNGVVSLLAIQGVTSDLQETGVPLHITFSLNT